MQLTWTLNDTLLADTTLNRLAAETNELRADRENLLRGARIEVLASQLGGALFLDVADAFDRWPPRPRSSVGVGARIVLPQLDRNVIRFDVGFPIERAEGAGPVGFYLALEQAFSARPPDASSSITMPSGSGSIGQ